MKARAVAVGLAAALIGAMGVITLSRGSAEAKVPAVSATVSPEVTRIASLRSRDAAQARKAILALYQKNGFQSGADYRTAAMVLEGSKDRKELLMAHDLAIAALTLGDREANTVVARTEDVLFKAVGLGERFGTLSGSSVALTPAHRRLMTSGESGKVPMPTAVEAAV